MKNSSLGNQKGQFVIEAVLLMIVMVGIFVASMNALRDSKFLSKLVSGPWERVAGMMESGVWAPAKEARQQHPNQRDRSITNRPPN
ncbi:MULTISPECIES: hypothetical protein [unclassified Bdellovibrio]|jgi:hypothetical protein|uniref:hypothetical protein n=1 Tax=unclassified Bdellovibrio TaxID=2633795 RepID=UPI0011570D10|nr:MULTISPECIES: hypothetical protein [unclassified Bdellovibrio]QDK43778.1 hypothetical protein DOM22_00650 [Bdellovibrio sp. ZAP7]QLY25598.1 hypothetical protein HW988_00655 [Bdellovibrio sp. KM01]